MLSTSEHQVLEFRPLGAFEVVVGTRVAVAGSPKQRALLAMLVVHLNRVVHLDAIVEELWGERLPTSASVQSLVSRLRRGLSDLCPEAGSRLRGREPGYVLEAEPAQVDANRFEELFARGRKAVERGEPDTAIDALELALTLWRGPALVTSQIGASPASTPAGWKRSASPPSRNWPRPSWRSAIPPRGWPAWSLTSPSTHCGSGPGARSWWPCTGWAVRPTPCAPTSGSGDPP